MDDWPAGGLRDDIEDFFPWKPGHPYVGVRAVGKYLWPRRVFVKPHENRASACTRIVRSIPVGAIEVALTAGFGLYATTPKEFGEYLETPSILVARAGRYGRRVATAFNSVICLLALDGYWSEPVTANELVPARRLDGRAHAFRVFPNEVNVPAEFSNGLWGVWEGAHLETFIARPLEDDLAKLLAISSECPYFVGSTYFAAMRLKYRQALFESFVVIEQYVAALYKNHIGPRKGQDLFKMHGQLAANSLIAPGIQDAITAARSARNTLVHSAVASVKSAELSLTALQRILEHVLGRKVAPLWCPQGWSW